MFMATLEKVIRAVPDEPAATAETTSARRENTDRRVRTTQSDGSAASLRPLILYRLSLSAPSREEIDKELYLLDCD